MASSYKSRAEWFARFRLEQLVKLPVGDSLPRLLWLVRLWRIKVRSSGFSAVRSVKSENRDHRLAQVLSSRVSEKRNSLQVREVSFFDSFTPDHPYFYAPQANKP